MGSEAAAIPETETVAGDEENGKLSRKKRIQCISDARIDAIRVHFGRENIDERMRWVIKA